MYAVYQIDGPVYGLGVTPEEAKRHACDTWIGNLTPDDAPIVRGKHLCCRPCSAALAARVETSGGDVVYELRDGVLCLIDEA